MERGIDREVDDVYIYVYGIYIYIYNIIIIYICVYVPLHNFIHIIHTCILAYTYTFT